MANNNYTKLAIVLAVIAGLYLLQNLINAKKYRRGRQAILPIIAFVYSAAATVLLTIYREPVVAKLNEWYQAITGNTGEIVSSAILVLNAALFLGYLLVKCVACPIVVKKWRSSELMELTSSRYYEYDDLYAEWFLSKRWANVRKMVNALAICFAVLTAGLLAITWINGPQSDAWLLYFPCAALVVLNEVRCFISGQTKDEYLASILGDEADSRRVGSFYRIRETYEKLFPGQLLASHSGTEFMAHKAATDMLSDLEASEDKIDRTVAQFFLTLDEVQKLEPDAVNATTRLMHGESAVFFNPFYRDLGVYLTLPIINTLLKGKNCLVVGGRSSTCEDVSEWLTDEIKEYSHMRSMWRVGALSKNKPDLEIGILTFQQLYDVDVLSANRAFLNDVEFVLIIEPSVMVNTGQIGFSIIAKETCQYGDAPVYCICDRYTDGLVDTMSHVLHTEITNVVAVPVPRCVYTGMAWNADGDFIRQKLFDKQTRYLGNGMELAAVAIKNQIPQVVWYGDTKSPLRDIKWIVGQHYSTLCRYMNIPTQQSALYEKIRFVPNLWSRAATREQFIIAEDEFCNMFTMMRAFLSRGIDQAFVNILSENYLLRDYMRCNQQMFLSNPNAIPSLIPDYAKSERNTVVKLLVMMAYRAVSENEVADELKLAGCEFDDTFDMFSKLLHKYTFVDGSVLDIQSVLSDENSLAIHKTTYYRISTTKFNEHFSDTIKNAYYIVEDEQSDRDYIDAKMFGHVTQTILPGQFVTYDGKYYQVHIVSPKNGVILRRASDLYTSRKYYRQLRTYHFPALASSRVVHAKTVTDIEYILVETDFSVTSSGYLELNDYHDLRMARRVSFADDPAVHSYDRKYHNKCVLKVKLPDTDDKIRFTISILLSEVFRSVFPDAWPYLAVLTARPDYIDGILNDVVYSVDGDIDPECIYVIEDSDIDLGLLDAVIRSLPQLLEIVADFLDWHFEKMREPEHEDPLPIDVKLPEQEKRRSLFLKMADRIRKLFGGKEEKVSIENAEKNAVSQEKSTAPELDEATVAEDVPAQGSDYVLGENIDEKSVGIQLPSLQPVEEGDQATDYVLDTEEETRSVETVQPIVSGDESPKTVHPEDEFEPEATDDADLVHIDGTDIFEDEGIPEDNDWLEEHFIAAGIVPIKKTRYQKECYLKYGYEDVDSRLKIEDVHKYLRVRGYSNNSLTKARTRDILEKNLLDFSVENHCDFCEAPLSGVSFEQLNDGRIRCNDCSASAISTVSEFQNIYYRVLEMMEMFYSIRFHLPISAKMTDARTIAKGFGQIFRPSTDVAIRTVGFAQRRGDRFSILMENGAPRLVAIDTIAHELTHIWQYINWKMNQVQGIYAMGQPHCTQKAVDIVMEGMAVWAAIQYLYQIGETYFASQQEEIERSKDDIYGIGFRLYCERYPLVKDMSLIKYSPFSSFPPLDPDVVKSAVKADCHEKECVC